MKRIALWFLIGLTLFTGFTADFVLHRQHPTGVGKALALVFAYWAYLTVGLIPIVVVVWIVRGIWRSND